MKIYSNAEKMFLEKSRGGKEIQCGGSQQCSEKARECGCGGVAVGFQLGQVYRSQAKAYLRDMAPDMQASCSPWLLCNQHSD